MVLQGIGMRRGDLRPALLLLNWPSLGTMKCMAKGLGVTIGVFLALALWFPRVVMLTEQKRNYDECLLTLVRAEGKDG